ncbi:MAG: Holliday junction branch migration protein RuvA [candidate division NC10 bacterium]|nr:Holliday junction branch migration protein RuvA [candidate division NC10 bacterium]
MIAQIRGRLASKEPHRVVVDVNGVGYRLFIPLSTFYQLPEVSAEVFLHTHTHVREDAIQLFGFHTRDEQALFELLQGVTGIGPRLATNILSGISVEELVPALSEGTLARLRAVPGVGKKLAERLVVELREKVGSARLDQGAAAPAGPAPAVDQPLEDVVSALVNLGCNRKEAIKAAEAARQRLGPTVEFEKLIKAALRALSESR